MRRAFAFALCAAAAAGCGEKTVPVEALSVVYIGPSPGAVGVGTDTDLRVTFSEVLRAESVTQASICVLSADAATENCAGDVVPAQVTYDAATLAITVQPLLLLTTSHDYTLRITSGIRGESGSLHTPIDSPFRTAP